jgi:hypothetical protein
METGQERTSSHSNKKKEVEMDRTDYVEIGVKQRGRLRTGTPRESEGRVDLQQSGGELLKQERPGEKSKSLAGNRGRWRCFVEALRSKTE